MSRPVPAALLPWLDALLCPHCREPFALTDRTLRCPSGHSFDLARAGYVSLLPGSAPISGDDDDMARARDSRRRREGFFFKGELLSVMVPAYFAACTLS